MVDERVDALDDPSKVAGLNAFPKPLGDHIGVGRVLLNRIGHDLRDAGLRLLQLSFEGGGGLDKFINGLYRRFMVSGLD